MPRINIFDMKMLRRSPSNIIKRIVKIVPKGRFEKRLKATTAQRQKTG